MSRARSNASRPAARWRMWWIASRGISGRCYLAFASIASYALLVFARHEPRAFNKLCHPWHVGGKQTRVGLGCQLVVGEWQGSEFLQLLPQARIGQSRAERRVERDDDFLWCALCHVEPMPHRIAD